MTSEAPAKAPVRKKQLSDERPWWDTFPWWGALIFAILLWMGWQIATNENYDLAWDRIIPGLRITIISTLQAFAIALIIGLLAGMGQLSRNVVLRNVARTYVEFIRGIPILPLIFIKKIRIFIVNFSSNDKFCLFFNLLKYCSIKSYS